MFTITLCIIGMAIVSRLCGMDKGLPFGLAQHLYALPYGLIGLLACHSSILLGVVSFTISYGFAFLGKRMGHGSYMDLGTYHGDFKPEKIEPLVKLIYKGDDEFVHDFIGLSITGLIVSLGLVSVLIAAGHLVSVLLVTIGALLKGAAYLIGLHVYPKKFTVVGEILTGAFAGLSLGLTYLHL